MLQCTGHQEWHLRSPLQPVPSAAGGQSATQSGWLEAPESEAGIWGQASDWHPSRHLSHVCPACTAPAKLGGLCVNIVQVLPCFLRRERGL